MIKETFFEKIIKSGSILFILSKDVISGSSY